MLETRILKCLAGLLVLCVCCDAVIKYPPSMVKQPPANEELLFQVASRVDENDKPFIIECEAEGEPVPKYRWEKNGKHFAWQTYDERMSNQPGRGTLVITKPRDEDMGQYQCFATNELGTATSNSVFVRKSVLNGFTFNDPITENVEEGDAAKLKCAGPDGYPNPLLNWLIQDEKGGIRSINNTRMTVDPEGTLWFSNVTRNDETNGFLYACAATSSFRNEYKIGNKVFMRVQQTGNVATLTKHAPKEQYVSKKNIQVLKGHELKLWCIFSGTPLPLIKWSKKNGHLPSERMQRDDYGKSLVIQYTDLEDAGTYECEASNGVGSAKSYTINVKVDAIPYFTKEPKQQNKAEGETATFECEAEGIPTPQIQWIYNGFKITPSQSNDRRQIETNRIVIHNLEKSDTGNYGCNASNLYGYSYKDVYVNVLALPPEIRVPPKKIKVVDGKDVNMTCETFGAPKPRITWIRDGLQLTGGRYQVQEDGLLVINKVTFTDGGEYQCIAKNRFGNQTARGSVTVKKRTKFTERPQDYEVPAGMTATFKCNAVADSDLELSIGWLTDGKEIDFVQEPRFVQQSDFSLSITKTTELDSGRYTCVASTELDSIEAHATLLVQDVPNAPELLNVICNDRDVSVRWKPRGDNRAPILGYIIQHNTSFTPETWENSFDHASTASTHINVNMSPWANYTYRVIAKNKIGPSQPSGHSKPCTTPPDVPYKNPEGVEGKGSNPRNLVIKWSPMPEIDHNGPGFRYQVYWKRMDEENVEWKTDTVVDWQQDHYIVENQPTYKPYKIKVEAHNELGQAHVTAEEIIGFSGEDVPLEAPKNLTMVELVDATTAILSWNPVSEKSIRGKFAGYKIQTWTEAESEDKARDITVQNNDEPRVSIDSFVPFIKNFVRVLVTNGAHDGPPSEIISFTTPEGVPGSIESLEAIPMGSTAFYLNWMEPKKPNGILTGYHIYYQEVNGTHTGPMTERQPDIDDPLIKTAKLASLKPATKYRLSVRGRTQVGQGENFFIERSTRSGGPTSPGKPGFIWQHINRPKKPAAIKVTWIPNIETNPGSHFFVEYKKYKESRFDKTLPILYEDSILLEDLYMGYDYEIRVVAVDGDYTTFSDVEVIRMYPADKPNGVPLQSHDTFATKVWFIGMMLAIAFLLLILVIVCVVKRNRGGKYAVHEREAAHGRTDFQEETAFPEYQHGDPKRSSMASDVKEPIDEDTDSMEEYEGGDTEGMAEDGSFIGQYDRVEGNQFTEDGSFIGQYGGANGSKKKTQEPTPAAVATFV